jgi:GT2 family glycosyltransferase
MKSTMDPSVSIVIVNWNGWSYLQSCLSSIAKLPEHNEIKIETIVVDNGSTDQTLTELPARFPWARVLSLRTNVGFAAASNAGARLANGYFLLFLNNDTIIEPGAIKSLIDAFVQHHQLGLCQPKLVYMKYPKVLDAVGSFLTWTGFLEHVGVREIDCGQYDAGLFVSLSPKGACIMLPRQLFWSLGGFDEDFFAYFEESDLAWRVWLAGYIAGMWPNAVVLHAVGATSSRVDFASIQYHSIKNRLCALIKNLDAYHLALMAPLHISMLLFLALSSLMRGKIALSSAILRALWWNLRHLPATMEKRRHVQTRIRKVSDREIFRLAMRRATLGKMIASASWFLRGRWGG